MYTSAIIVAGIIAFLLGGDLRRLASLETRRFSWILASFAVPFVVEYISSMGSKSTPMVSAVATTFSYGALLYGLAANLHIAGIFAVMLGSISNFIVIAANSFRMPVRLDSFDAGVRVQEAAKLAESITHTALDFSTRVPFLADVLSWKYFVARPSMVSVGDVMIAAGLGWLVFRTARPRFFG